VAFGVPAALGIGVGVGLFKRRRWAWFLAGLCYAQGLFAGVAYLLYGRAWLPLTIADQSDWASWVSHAAAAVETLVAASLYLSFYRRGVRRFFALELSWWIPLLVQLAVCAMLVLPTFNFIGNRVSTYRISRLQAIGEYPGATDEESSFALNRLEQGNERERIVAAWALGRIERNDTLPALLRAARTDASAQVRVNAVASIAQLGGEGVEQDLLSLLESDDEAIRAAALGALARGGFTLSVQQAGAALDSDSAELRALAVDILGGLGSLDAVPLLSSVAGDPAEDVRSRAAFALGKLGDRRATPTLVEMLGDDRWEVRANAAQALGMLGDASARSKLRPLLEDPNAQVRWATEAALGKLD
jgi:HEAT repeat protein